MESQISALQAEVRDLRRRLEEKEKDHKNERKKREKVQEMSAEVVDSNPYRYSMSTSFS
jgi:ribosomal protein S15P/S13E